MPPDFTTEIVSKMGAAGCSTLCIKSFLQSRKRVKETESYISEISICPVRDILCYESLSTGQTDNQKSAACAVLKLNGGLGTSMGLQGAKSLIEVKPGASFLDIILQQLTSITPTPHLLLLNSVQSQKSVQDYLNNTHNSSSGGSLSVTPLTQHNVPRLAPDGKPISWMKDPAEEWCPPGHGNLYTVLYETGKLETLLSRGYECIFISNSDNLGATLDTKILEYFMESSHCFLMEVCMRQKRDRKGGHLAHNIETGGLVLREKAQCDESDMSFFEDIDKHSYFNTNNLWVKTRQLYHVLKESGGVLPLPVIRNPKIIGHGSQEERQLSWQLETAAGSAISVLGLRSAAISVPRNRFRPVKHLSDLLVLRSDAYAITPDGELQLLASGEGPDVQLDEQYRTLEDIEDLTPFGVPSLRYCTSLRIRGKVIFESGVIIRGEVIIENERPNFRCVVQENCYENTNVVFSSH